MSTAATAELGSAGDATYATTCWECSTNCGALATVRDDRVIEYGPNPDAPHSKGAFCIKGIRGASGLTYNQNRLLFPHRRIGARGEGRWARISWDEALDEMADQLTEVRRRYWPEAIVGATSGGFFSRSVVTALIALTASQRPSLIIDMDIRRTPWIDPASVEKFGVLAVWPIDFKDGDQAKSALTLACLPKPVAIPWPREPRREPFVLHYCIIHPSL